MISWLPSNLQGPFWILVVETLHLQVMQRAKDQFSDSSIIRNASVGAWNEGRVLVLRTLTSRTAMIGRYSGNLEMADNNQG